MGCPCVRGRPTISLHSKSTQAKSQAQQSEREKEENVPIIEDKLLKNNNSLNEGNSFDKNDSKGKEDITMISQEKEEDNHLIKINVNKCITEAKKDKSSIRELFPSIPSFNEFSKVTVQNCDKQNNSKTFNMTNQKSIDSKKLSPINSKNGNYYMDFFTKKRIDLRKNPLSSNNTFKMSISNSSLSCEHTPTFSEEANSKGVVNVTNITTININPIIVGKANTNKSTSPRKILNFSPSEQITRLKLLD